MLADAIASLGTLAFTVTHQVNNGFDAHGRAIAPTPSVATITGMMQPLSGREIDRLPEGLHARELRALWTTGALQVPDSDAQTQGDHVTDVSGVVWEVVRAEEWSALGSPYNRYVLSRVDP
jgi:hypothetical protein